MPARKASAPAQVLRPVPHDDDVPDVDARGRRSCSASQGPLRSVTRPVSTSVPVTTMPARAPHPADPRGALVSGCLAGPSGTGRGYRAGRSGPIRRAPGARKEEP